MKKKIEKEPAPIAHNQGFVGRIVKKKSTIKVRWPAVKGAKGYSVYAGNPIKQTKTKVEFTSSVVLDSWAFLLFVNWLDWNSLLLDKKTKSPHLIFTIDIHLLCFMFSWQVSEVKK